MGQNSERFIAIQEELFEIGKAVMDGELAHLDALIQMRQNREQAETVLKIVKEFEDENQNRIANEAEQYGGKYQGYEIKSVNGKKIFNYKSIEEIETVENTVANLKDKYKSAFENYQKGNQLTEMVDGVLHWIDGEGFMHPFPELTIGKSFLTVTKSKK